MMIEHFSVSARENWREPRTRSVHGFTSFRGSPWYYGNEVMHDPSL